MTRETEKNNKYKVAAAAVHKELITLVMDTYGRMDKPILYLLKCVAAHTANRASGNANERTQAIYTTPSPRQMSSETDSTYATSPPYTSPLLPRPCKCSPDRPSPTTATTALVTGCMTLTNTTCSRTRLSSTLLPVNKKRGSKGFDSGSTSSNTSLHKPPSEPRATSTSERKPSTTP